MGTLKLEETDHAVASDQAADLLPLWQVLNSLSSSDTAAQEEINAITEQIQETMTAEQLAAIEAMELTGEDIFATMQELGLTYSPGQREGTPRPGFRGGQGPGGGGFPGGGPVAVADQADRKSHLSRSPQHRRVAQKMVAAFGQPHVGAPG